MTFIMTIPAHLKAAWNQLTLHQQREVEHSLRRSFEADLIKVRDELTEQLVAQLQNWYQARFGTNGAHFTQLEELLQSPTISQQFQFDLTNQINAFRD